MFSSKRGQLRGLSTLNARINFYCYVFIVSSGTLLLDGLSYFPFWIFLIVFLMLLCSPRHSLGSVQQWPQHHRKCLHRCFSIGTSTYFFLWISSRASISLLLWHTVASALPSFALFFGVPWVHEWEPEGEKPSALNVLRRWPGLSLPQARGSTGVVRVTEAGFPLGATDMIKTNVFQMKLFLAQPSWCASGDDAERPYSSLCSGEIVSERIQGRGIPRIWFGKIQRRSLKERRPMEHGSRSTGHRARSNLSDKVCIYIATSAPPSFFASPSSSFVLCALVAPVFGVCSQALPVWYDHAGRRKAQHPTIPHWRPPLERPFAHRVIAETKWQERTVRWTHSDEKYNANSGKHTE